MATWFDGDGTHLSSEGAQAYIDMVHDAIGSLSARSIRKATR